MEHIEVMFEQATHDNWDLKLDKDDIKVWVKRQPKAGTDHPFIKTEILFNSAFEIPKLIEAVLKPIFSLTLCRSST
jgi:hypothetical protein